MTTTMSSTPVAGAGVSCLSRSTTAISFSSPPSPSSMPCTRQPYFRRCCPPRPAFLSLTLVTSASTIKEGGISPLISNCSSFTSADALGARKERDQEIDHSCSLIMVSLNMETVSQPVREKLSFSPIDEYSCVIQQLLALPSIKEAFILNGTPDNSWFEVYTVVQPTPLGLREVINWLSKRSGLDVSELEQQILVRRDGKAGRHLLEAAADGVLPHEGSSSFLFSAAMCKSKSAGFGVVLSDLATKALCLRPISAQQSISSAAFDVARAAQASDMKNPQFLPRILVIGLNSTSDLLIKEYLISYNNGRRKIIVVCPDYQVQDHWESIPFRPMSDLLSSISESNLIFIAEPLLSRADIADLPPPVAYDEDDNPVILDSSRIIIDMCHPPCIKATSQSRPISSRVFNIDDIFAAMDRRGSKLRNEITEEVEDFESWVKEAVGGANCTANSSSTFAERCSIIDESLTRNLERKSPLLRKLASLS